METTEAFLGLDCTGCGERFDADATPGRCPECDAPLSPAYDLDAVDPDAVRAAAGRAGSMWETGAPLPFADPITAEEGATPLVDAGALADELGVERVLVKDESRNPTGTVLDRGLSPAVTAARAHGTEPLALASPGNSGQSAAAYAGRADLRAYAFLPSRAPFSNKAMVNVHGGEMRVVGGRFDDAVETLHDDLQTEWHSLQEFTTPYRHDGLRTLAYELAADLDWTAPDAVVTPVSTGELPVGLAAGFRELVDLGLVESVPPVYGAQAAGCAPVAAAWERGADDTEAWTTPDTIAGELEVPDPAGGALALDAVADTGGAFVAAEDDDILESAVAVTKTVGVEMGAAAGAAAAGAWDLADDLSGTVVLLNTEAGAKTADVLRSHLMGQGI